MVLGPPASERVGVPRFDKGRILVLKYLLVLLVLYDRGGGFIWEYIGLLELFNHMLLLRRKKIANARRLGLGWVLLICNIKN